MMTAGVRRDGGGGMDSKMGERAGERVGERGQYRGLGGSPGRKRGSLPGAAEGWVSAEVFKVSWPRLASADEGDGAIPGSSSSSASL
jgi:hypothetical protein